MERKKVELLCPVGGLSQLIAAVENGADAVYMGGLGYNARMYADNFNTVEEIEKAVDYAHLRNVKVYVTLNTLVNDQEIYNVLEYSKTLYKLGVDAVIVQDIGVIDLLNKELPNLRVHVSTQGTIYSKDGVNFFNTYSNVDRVVLARELSISEISNIVNSVEKEIEVFVHGALCVCYSGQCKLSSFIGDRSGNRGKCAQPCRLPYHLENVLDEENYYLSTKDICTIEMLPSLIQTGVHSLKIEGRMKSPEYVAAVTRIYRKYIDLSYTNNEYVVDKKDKETLLQVFNRGGFSEGYLKTQDPKEIWCNSRPKNSGTYLGQVLDYDKKKGNIKVKLEREVANGDLIEVVNKELSSAMVSYIRLKNDIVKKANIGDIVIIGDIKGKIEKGQKIYKIISKELNEELRKSFCLKSIKKNNVECEIKIGIDEVPKVSLKCNILGKDISVCVEYGEKCEKSIKKSLTKEEIIQIFSKTGDVPFKLKNIEVKMSDNLFTKVSNLNNIRRKAFEVLSEEIVNKFKHHDLMPVTQASSSIRLSDRNVNTKLSAYIHKGSVLKDYELLRRFDRVYFSLEDVIKNKEEIVKAIPKEKIFIYIPTVTNQKYREYIKENMSFIKEIRNILITNIEHIEMFKNMKFNICLDNSFNVFNSESLRVLNKYNISSINLSNELTLEQIKKMRVEKNSKVEVDVYGNLQVMYSNFCALKANNRCGLCKNIKYNLVDRKGKKFPCIFNNIGCNMQILNADKLFSLEATKQLVNKVEYMRVYIYDETKEKIKQVLDTIDNIKKGKSEYNIVSNNEVKYTNGHFFREV